MDRRTRTWKRLTEGMADAAGQDAIEIIDGVAFDYRGEPRCLCCAAGEPTNELSNGESVRRRIDAGIVLGLPYSAILEDISEMVQDWPVERRPSYASIRRHQLRHLQADQAAVREILERRAIEEDVRIAVGRAPIITAAGVYEVIRARGLEAIVSGAAIPNVRETLAATQALQEIDREVGPTVSDLAAEFRAFIGAVRSRLPESAWDEILGEVQARADARQPALGPGVEPGSGEEVAP